MKLKQFVRFDSLHRKQIIRVHALSRAITNVIFEQSPSPVSSPIGRAMYSGVLRCDLASLGKTHVIYSAILYYYTCMPFTLLGQKSTFLLGNIQWVKHFQNKSTYVVIK